MEMEITGLDELLRRFKSMNISEELENRALTKAGKIVQKSIIEEAPEDKKSVPDSSSLKKNIKLRRPKDGEAYVHTGGAYHAHLVEFGRSGGSAMAMKNGKRQKVTWGPTNPNPFFSRGFGLAQEEAKKAMVEEIKKGLGL